jgi:heme iron utilization protein
VLCLSQLAEHTRNLDVDPRASLLVSPPVAPGADPLAAVRLTLVGRVEPVPGNEAAATREAHLAGNPHAAGYAGHRPRPLRARPGGHGRRDVGRRLGFDARSPR